jgi:D-alanyl-D-alanine carboxypeptidase
MKTLLPLFFSAFFATSLFAQLERTESIVSVRSSLLAREHTNLKLDLSQEGKNRALAIDATLPSRLQHALDSLMAKTTTFGKHGVSAAVIVPGLPLWSGTAGESYEGMPMTTDLRFEMASNTKTFTTAFIMQLAEEGKLSISDSLWKWLPHYNNIDSNITIKQLLEHSSGIYDYLNDDPNGVIITDAYVLHPDKVWTPEEIVSGYIGAPNFKAGTSYRYSNTNFLLAGMIAAKAAGAEYGSELHRRFLTPLGLANTFVGWRDSITGEFAHNWIDTVNNKPMVDLGDIEKTAQLSMANTAGGNISIPRELVQWVKNLYQGTLLSAASIKQMTILHTWPDNSRYGLGTAWAPYGSKSFYGHSGALPGFYSMMFDNPKDSVAFVVYINSSPFQNDVQLNDYAIAILNEIYKPAAGAASDPALSLAANVFPNPASSRAEIHYTLVKAGHVELSLFNSIGEKVLPLVSETQDAGTHTAMFNAAHLVAGAYTYRLMTESGMLTGQVMVVR